MSKSDSESRSERSSDEMFEHPFTDEFDNKLGENVPTVDCLRPSLPSQVKRRVNALRNLQIEKIKIDAQLCYEMHKLETRFESKYLPLYAKRSQIVSGEYEPNGEECAEESDLDVDQEMTEHSSQRKTITGIPEFWLTVLTKDELIGAQITARDEPVLKHLNDIQFRRSVEPLKISLVFHFSPNDYFSNKELALTYYLQCDPKWGNLTVLSIEGTQIEWKEGKNVTLQLKTGGKTKDTQQAVRSFFGLFSPPDASETSAELSLLLDDHWSVGNALCYHLIPSAVEYFTGKVCQSLIDDELILGEFV